MTHGEMGIRATIVATFINDLLIDGTDSTAISILRDGFKTDASASFARNMVNNLIHYFESSDNPIEEFLYFIGIESAEAERGEQSINTLLYMDEKQTPFLTDIPLSGDGVTVLNAALALHFVGMKNNADNLARIGIKLLMEAVFSD